MTTPRILQKLILIAAVWASLPEAAWSQQNARGSFAPLGSSSVRSRCVGVLGEVTRPGVYQLPGERVEFGELLTWAGNPTRAASGNVRLLRNGKVHSLDISSRSLQSELVPGDVLILDSSTTPQNGRSQEGLVRTQSFEPDSASRSSNTARRGKTDVQLAYVGLFDRPVVAPVRAEDATLGNLLAQLEQPAEVAATVRVISPGQSTAKTWQERSGDDSPLESGSVLVFEPSALRHDHLPAPPAVIFPDTAAHRVSRSTGAESEDRGLPAAANDGPVLPPEPTRENSPGIYATFVARGRLAEAAAMGARMASTLQCDR